VVELYSLGFDSILDVAFFMVNLATVLVLAWSLGLLVRYLQDRKRDFPFFQPIWFCGAASLAGGFWMEFQDFRPLTVLFPVLTYGLIRSPKVLETYNVRASMNILIGFVMVCACWFQLGRWVNSGGWGRSLRVVQPGGKYVAEELDDYGGECVFIVLRPNRFHLSSILDYPDRRVAEFEYSVSGLRWDSPTQLTVLVPENANLYWKKSGWQEVSIRYVTVKPDVPKAAAAPILSGSRKK
jgi:hypothetical protein